MVPMSIKHTGLCSRPTLQRAYPGTSGKLELHHFVVDFDIGQLACRTWCGGSDRRPAGVDHTDLGDGGVAADFLEVRLEELDVGLIHGKAALFTEVGRAGCVKLGEAFDAPHRCRLGDLHFQRFAHLEAMPRALQRGRRRNA